MSTPRMPEHTDFHIDHPEGEEELDQELERDFEEETQDDPVERERIHQAVEKVNTESVQIEERSDRDDFIADLSRDVEIGQENYGDTEMAETLKEMREFLEAAKKERDANSKPKSKWAAAKRFLAIAMGIGAIGAGIYALIRYFSEKSKGRDPSKNPELKDMSQDTLNILEQMYHDWEKKTPADFFGQLAAKARTTPALSIGDHIYFMDLVIKLKALKAPFLWESVADKLAMIDWLCDVWTNAPADAATNEKIARLYDAAAAETYDDDPVPTKIMAGVLRLVFARLGFDPKYKVD